MPEFLMIRCPQCGAHKVYVRLDTFGLKQSVCANCGFTLAYNPTIKAHMWD